MYVRIQFSYSKKIRQKISKALTMSVSSVLVLLSDIEKWSMKQTICHLVINQNNSNYQ